MVMMDNKVPLVSNHHGNVANINDIRKKIINSTETTMQDVIETLNFIHKLANQNHNLTELNDLLSSTFKLFLNIQNLDINKCNILSYTQDPNSNDSIQYIYLNFKLSYLKLFSLSSNFKDFNEIIQAFQYNSHFYITLLKYNTIKPKFAFQITSAFLKLSSKIKTVNRLTFLILSAQYSLFTNNIDTILFKKISSDAIKMLNKSDSLVYKATATHLYSFYQSCLSFNIDLDYMSELIDIYKTKEMKFKIGIIWDSNKLQSVNLTTSLENMNISENLSSIIETNSFENMVTCESEIKKTLTIIKKLDFNDSSLHSLISKLVSSVCDKIDKYSLISSIFDLLTLKFKDISCASENFDFLYSNLNQMSQTIKQSGKKLSNFTKLFYHYGTLVMDIEPLSSIPFWDSFFILELKKGNLPTGVSTKKVSYICNNLIKKSNFIGLVTIISLYLNHSMDDSRDIFIYEDEINHKFTDMVQLLTKSIVYEPKLIDLLFLNIKNESLLVSLILNIINYMVSLPISLEDSSISNIILKSKDDLIDTGLFLFFLSRVSMIVDFPINFKNNELSINNDSLIYNMQNLIISHLYLLQTFSNTDTSSQALLKSYESALYYLGNVEIFTSYEFTVITSIYQVLKYNQLFNYSIILLEKYIEKQSLSQHYKNDIISELIDCHIKLEDLSKCKKYIQPIKGLNNDSIYAMKYQLSILNYDIINKDYNIDDINTIYNTFKNSDIFSIQKQTDKYKVIELLVLHAKFNKIVSFVDESSHINAITNLNRAISVLQSIFKNFLLPNSASLNLNTKSILKTKFSYEMLDCYALIIDNYAAIGFGKELDYYMNQLNVFLQIQPSLNIQNYFNLKLLHYNLFKNNIDKATHHYECIKANEKYVISDNNQIFEAYSLIIYENYFRKMEDIQSLNINSQILDDHIYNILSEMTESKNSYLNIISKWINILRKRIGLNNKFSIPDNNQNLKSNGNFDKMINSLHDYYKCLNYFEKVDTNLDRSISVYPTLEIFNENSNTHINEAKICVSRLMANLKQNFNTETIEISKNIFDMNFNLIIKSLQSCKSINLRNEVKDLITINDEFQRSPFILEKQFSSLIKQKEFLPEIPNFSTDTNLKFCTDNLKLNEVLPTDWIVVSIGFSEITNSIYLSKYDQKNDKPIFIDISLDQKLGTCSYQSIIDKLNSIINKSDETTKFEVTSKVQTYEEKRNWWETRKKLDDDLSDLLQFIDNHWFGGFNGLFDSQSNEYDTCFKNEIIQIIEQSMKIENKAAINNLNEISDRIYELFLKINGIKNEKINDILIFILETAAGKHSIEFFDIGNICENIKVQITNYTNKELILNKSEGHIVLIPSSNCTKIPWESMPSLKNKSVTRMPTLHQLKDYLIKYKNLMTNGIDVTKGYYVINPGADLKQTELNLAPRFKILEGWDGKVGEPPKDEDILNAFDNKNLYVYAGHGGGEQYVKSKFIKQRNYIPPTLLLGCSSGLLKGSGLIHPYGTAYNYINGGCPMLLVNLWDVTDKDIDKFTIETLTKWGFLDGDDEIDLFDLSVESYTLAQCVSRSRDVCKLKYLNGAAPIIYGLPLSLELM